MRGREFERLARKYLLPLFPQLEVDRGLLYAKPTELLLRGIAVDSSAFSATVLYLNCFIQPLVVPADDLQFPFVFRLRDPRDNQGGWDLEKREADDVFAGIAGGIRAQFIPLLDKYAEPAALQEWPGAWKGIHKAEAVAYGLVLKGEAGSARKWLNRVQELGDEDGRDWALAVASRARLVSETLDRGIDTAAGLLRQWAQETRSKVLSNGQQT